MKLFIRIFISTAFLLSINSAVYAGAPDCGDVDRDVADDAYEAAHDLRLYADVESDIERVCTTMEGFERYYNELPREGKVDPDFKKARSAAIRNIETDLADLRGPLIALRVWVRSDEGGAFNRAKREAHIKSNRNTVKSVLNRMEMHEQKVKNLMNGA